MERQVGGDLSRAAAGKQAGGTEYRQTEADLHERDAPGVGASPGGQVRHHDDVSSAGRGGQQDQYVTQAGFGETVALREQPDPEHRDHRRAIEGCGQPGAVNPPL